MSVTENLEEVERRIQAACDRAGRDRSEVTLIAVSKTKPIEMIEEAMSTGIRVFGENKVQEIVDKADTLNDDSIKWHMIGHLQTNKVKYLPGRATMIHSVDSEKLALEINKQFGKAGLVADILIEVNVAGEESKFGVAPDEVEDLLKKIGNLPNIKVKGLMTIAPYVDVPEQNRTIFCDLRKIMVDINEKKLYNIDMSELSMGMTGDYEVAIEEGATYVRVGTGIFGSRIYI